MTAPKIAIVWRGDREARRNATPANNRFHRVFEELAAVGNRCRAGRVRRGVCRQGTRAATASRWRTGVGQSASGWPKTREALDPLLREVAEGGPWVSAHPDVIVKMGIKEVLYRTRHLGWGVDTHLYRSAAEFRDSFPGRLTQSGPRVLKQNRGNDGQGVWKVERLASNAETQSYIADAIRAAAPRFGNTGSQHIPDARAVDLDNQ